MTRGTAIIAGIAGSGVAALAIGAAVLGLTAHDVLVDMPYLIIGVLLL